MVNAYDTGSEADKEPLNNLIRAFRKIQSLEPDDLDSFFTIAGYHGEPFRADDPSGKNENWWGGYCQHQTILFPTWHRAYVYRLESALRNQLPEADISLPFWDECITHGSTGEKKDAPIPWPFTTPTFELDGSNNNPLYSYKLAKKVYDTEEKDNRYTKDKDYQTVRYPLSGLNGNEVDKKYTEVHNSQFMDPVKNAEILNGNVKEWLDGTAKITPDKDGEKIMADTYSLYGRYILCLEAPNYTVFSNNASAKQWIKENGPDPEKMKKYSHYVVSLESPHNGIHLSLGGFYQEGQYNANPIVGSNGDMGENETAAFDPIFFFHHCFIDYVFWQWQVRAHKTTGTFDIITKAADGTAYPGTISLGLPDYPDQDPLAMDSKLYPFKDEKTGEYFTSNDLVNIVDQLGYDYGTGSFTPIHVPMLMAPEISPITKFIQVSNIHTAHYPGSFVIRTSIELPDGTYGEIGRDPILSRWNVDGCANCQNHLAEESYVPVDEQTLAWITKDKELKDVKFQVDIQSRFEQGLAAPTPNLPRPTAGWLE
jgi:tyrosinase